MMKDELKLLEQLVAGYTSGIYNYTGLSTQNGKVQQARIIAECHRIKKAWTGLLFSQAKEDTLKRYTRFQQQVLLELADVLYEHIKEGRRTASPGDAPALGLAGFLLDQLLQLKEFQIRYFNTYINKDDKIPDAVIPLVRKRMANLAGQLSADLRKVELDAGLKTCILDYLSGVIRTDATAQISYRAAEYSVTFSETVSIAIGFDHNADLTRHVTEVLFYLNFNQNSFCQWYQERIATEKAALEPPARLYMLLQQRLRLKSMQVILTMGYDPKALPVNSLLENWLNEFIRQDAYQPERDEAGLPPDKAELALTVAQLALLIRLLYEEGVFATKNIAALLRFFSGHFMSKKQKHISNGSMNKLYYSGDQFTGYAVRELLLKMVAKINKMFFPT